MLRSEQLLQNLVKRWKLSSTQLISKRIHVCGLSLDRQRSSKQREQLRTLNASQTNNSMRDSMHACVSCSCHFWPIATSFELRYRSCTSAQNWL